MHRVPFMLFIIAGCNYQAQTDRVVETTTDRWWKLEASELALSRGSEPHAYIYLRSDADDPYSGFAFYSVEPPRAYPTDNEGGGEWTAGPMRLDLVATERLAYDLQIDDPNIGFDLQDSDLDGCFEVLYDTGPKSFNVATACEFVGPYAEE